MLFEDTYQTIERPVEGVFRDRGSKFLAFAYPISSEKDIKDIIISLKAEHPKANHHCWAMRLGIDRSVFRLNDDGEPSGTAGRPILNTLLSHNLTNLLVVVTRYFGGTLLGVPGLINAYKMATEDCLKQAIVIEKTVKDVYNIGFDYSLMNEIMRIVKDEDLVVLTQQFDIHCSMQVAIRKLQVNGVLNRLNRLTGITVKYEHSI
jgi:uncharacterized YigZ family protein